MTNDCIKKVDHDALMCELVMLHHIESATEAYVSILKDYSFYQKENDVRTGFTDLKITSSDVGKTVLDFLVSSLSDWAKLSDWQWKRILEMPEARKNAKET